ncbi:MAG: type II toxin-antitoxin system RelE/ParE family toxin [Gammaproteobacteria bacterium]
MRDALVALCPPAETLEQPLNARFAAQRPRAVKKRRWHLAIDLQRKKGSDPLISHKRKAELKLDQLDAATSLLDLDLPGNRLEALKGDRKGQYSICINEEEKRGRTP